MKINELLANITGYFTVEEVKSLEAAEANVLRIEGGGIEMVGHGPQASEEPVLAFTGTKKKLVINKTRGQQLAALFGLNADIPKGATIRLVVRSANSRDQIMIEAVE